MLTDDPRVYTNLKDLNSLEHRARGFSFLPRQPVHSILAGRHSSRLRGRGLNFEEIRGYLPGDDIRNIDWKVTARLRKPHVRVYTEERDRPAILLVDQRISMFFGSSVYVKSVTAARLAALVAWTVFHAGDRVGAVVFNDREIRMFPPLRSRRRILEIFQAVVEMNRALDVEDTSRANYGQLTRALEQVRRLAKHDHLIAIMSDFAGADDESARLILQMVQHNDLFAAVVHDPMAMELGSRGRLVVSEGELQVEVDLGDRKEREPLLEFTRARLQDVVKYLKKLAIPVLPVHTGEDVVEQVRQMLGHQSEKRF
ncbi:MAG: DUF58 domain-containing protein [Acidobacteriota bacterium]|nr:MAG: DUF58 domain-containing protein [Acidobacteriota bacterium]